MISSLQMSQVIHRNVILLKKEKKKKIRKHTFTHTLRICMVTAAAQPMGASGTPHAHPLFLKSSRLLTIWFSLVSQGDPAPASHIHLTKTHFPSNEWKLWLSYFLQTQRLDNTKFAQSQLSLLTLLEDFVPARHLPRKDLQWTKCSSNKWIPIKHNATHT